MGSFVTTGIILLWAFGQHRINQLSIKNASMIYDRIINIEDRFRSSERRIFELEHRVRLLVAKSAEK